MSLILVGAPLVLGTNHRQTSRRVRDKKKPLDRLRPLVAGALAQLRKYYDVEPRYTSNPIERNTLTHRETAEVIEHGVTVGGKPLRDHLEHVPQKWTPLLRNML